MLNNDELLFVVDEENNPLEPKPRSVVHNEHIWHRTAHIWIVNKKKEILCQQRSMLKDTSPGTIDPYFGGHLAPGVTYIDGALKELHEELGINATEKDLEFFRVYKNEANVEFQGIFYMVWDGDISTVKFEKEEVKAVKWFPLVDVWSFIVLEKKEGWSKIEYAEKILEWLINLQK